MHLHSFIQLVSNTIHCLRLIYLYNNYCCFKENLLVLSKNALNLKYDNEVKSRWETKTCGSEPVGTKPNYVWPHGKWFIDFVSNDPPRQIGLINRCTLWPHCTVRYDDKILSRALSIIQKTKKSSYYLLVYKITVTVKTLWSINTIMFSRSRSTSVDLYHILYNIHNDYNYVHILDNNIILIYSIGNK